MLRVGENVLFLIHRWHKVLWIDTCEHWKKLVTGKNSNESCHALQNVCVKKYSVSISKLDYLIFKLSWRLTTLHYLASPSFCENNRCGTVFLFPKSLTRCSRFFLVFYSKYSLKGIVNVEENHDVMKGDRYLIELVSQFCISNVVGKHFWSVFSCSELKIIFLSLQELNVEGRSEWFLSKLKLKLITCTIL